MPDGQQSNESAAMRDPLAEDYLPEPAVQPEADVLEEKVAEAEATLGRLNDVQALFGAAIDGVRQELAEASAAVQRATTKLSELENRLR